MDVRKERTTRIEEPREVDVLKRLSANRIFSFDDMAQQIICKFSGLSISPPTVSNNYEADDDQYSNEKPCILIHAHSLFYGME